MLAEFVFAEVDISLVADHGKSLSAPSTASLNRIPSFMDGHTRQDGQIAI
jgi:hypothetical protein